MQIWFVADIISAKKQTCLSDFDLSLPLRQYRWNIKTIYILLLINTNTEISDKCVVWDKYFINIRLNEWKLLRLLLRTTSILRISNEQF